MVTPLANLRLLDESASLRELDLASELFHRVNRLIPADQQLTTVAPRTPVREAIALMEQRGYSQLPIVEGQHVVGVFSYRSFASKVAQETLEGLKRDRCAPGDLPVDEYCERFEFARVTEEIAGVFDAIDRDNGILIGSPERLMGILTPMDILKYYYKVASPFVLISEIELSLRSLIGGAIPEVELEGIARRCLREKYGENGRIPTRVEDMTLGEYETLITFGDYWQRFEPLLGGTRSRVAAKLAEVRKIRDDVFHFKRPLTDEDQRALWNHRDWILLKVRIFEESLKAGERA